MKQQSITDLPQSPGDERRSRMIKYSIAMGVRVLCIVSMVVLRGWWLILPAIGAVVLPYFAVVLANVGAPARSAAVHPSGAVAVTGGPVPRDYGGRPE